MSGFRLRPEQQKVIDCYEGGYAAIAAVPGAGKTTTLSALAANLIARLGPRQRVVIVTYQNAAVANFQRAVAQRLEERGMPQRGFMVRTLHSLANEVLSSVRHRAELDVRATVIDERDADLLLDDIILQAQGRHEHTLRELVENAKVLGWRKWPQDYGKDLRDIVKDALAELRALGGDIDAFRQRAGGFGRWLPFVLDVCATYEQTLNEQGYLEYDDLVARAVDALERDVALRERLRRRWPYLLEDEAQDSSPLLERMLRLIAGEDGNLVRVGDANQSILTTFTQSDVEGFRRWMHDERVHLFTLTESSRSTQVILDLANRFIDRVQESFPVEEARLNALEPQFIRPVTSHDGGSRNPPVPRANNLGVEARKFEETEVERREVVGRALAYLRKFPEHTVAILVGGKDVGYEYAEEARKQGFPDKDIIRLLSGRDGRQVGLISKIRTIVAYLDQPDRPDLLAKMLSVWSSSSEDDRVEQAVRRLGRDATALSDVLYPGRGASIGASLNLPADLDEAERQTLARLRAVPGWLENRLAQPHELLSFIGSTVGLDDTERQLFDAVSITVGSVPADPRTSRLAQLDELLKELEQRQRRLRGTYEDHEIRIEPGSLTISTRHQAKGLEWDVVFAVGCDDYWFRGSLDFRRPKVREFLGEFDPLLVVRAEIESAANGMESYPSEADLLRLTQKQCADEVCEGLRVMYVTITRARRALWLSWHSRGFVNGSPWPRHESPVFPLLARVIDEIREGGVSVAAD